MSNLNIDRFSRFCCYLGLGIGLIIFICNVVIHAFDIEIAKMIPTCHFFKVTKYYCPGCGGTRSVNSLLRGDIVGCIYYHPFVAYVAVCYVGHELSHLLSIMTGNRIKGLKISPAYFYVGIVIIIVQWLLKNIMAYYSGFSL